MTSVRVMKQCWGVLVVMVVVWCACAGGTDGEEVSVMSVWLAEAGDVTDPAPQVGQLVVAALRERGLRARLAGAPAECAAGGGARACRGAVLRALVGGGASAALLAVPAARPPPAVLLRDTGLRHLGDAAPPARLRCHAAPAAATPRSLLDLADQRIATLYHHSWDDVDTALRAINSSHIDGKVCGGSKCMRWEWSPEWCAGDNLSCATILTDTEHAARALADTVAQHALRAHVRALATPLWQVAAALAPRALLACSPLPPPRSLRLAALAPPPCADDDTLCPFDPYRLIKLLNVRVVHSPSAESVMGRFELNEAELRELSEGEAVQTLLARHPEWTRARGELRTAVMVPLATPREAYDGPALAAAALLAEEDCVISDEVSFKVELLNDRCASTPAFKYLTEALGAEFGALSGVAGPACGAAFADVARQSPSLSLPVLGYTWQAAPAGAAKLALLAAGDARRGALAWAALASHFGWRRIAVLSELATRASLDVADLQADIIVHVELPADGDSVDYDKIEQWSERVRAASGRVVVVSAEDARVVRAALCAGRRRGLVPAAGCVWLLPALPGAALWPAPADRHNCTAAQLRDVADGHLSVAPAWLADWEAGGGGAARDAWLRRWAKRCARCADAPPHAALLYDVLQLWAGALRRLLARSPVARDDIHTEDIARSLIEDATGNPFSGLTGEFLWEESGGAKARSSPLIVQQWDNGTLQRVATWEDGALSLGPAALRWRTPDGHTPDDGAERCALQPLADLLHADCRAAFVALAALLLALLVSVLAAAAWHCKRRAERQYRERLAALGLSRLVPKPGGLDRWEIPRERVVINRKLGTGAFGTVYGGHALLAEDRGWSAVAVKMLKAGATTEEKLDFLSEAEAMKRFEHKNVVRLLGVVTKTEPVCTVMEFMLYGDLKNYLLARRHLAAGGEGGGEGTGAADEVSPARLTGMALDAARALSYLAQMRYVHRDVAARNCLVSAHRVLKLADFGMTRLVFENDYYRFSRKGMLPVRWMAPESLALGVFSPASDVWSFGVLLYEIVTFGSLPFQGLSNAEVLARVKAGQTLELPPGLKPQLEGLITSCWERDYKQRPGAAELAAFLADSPRLLTPCLDVPLDALPLSHHQDPWRADTDRAEARWMSWGAPASAATDTTYLSDAPPPQDTDAFLP